MDAARDVDSLSHAPVDERGWMVSGVRKDGVAVHRRTSFVLGAGGPTAQLAIPISVTITYVDYAPSRGVATRETRDLLVARYALPGLFAPVPLGDGHRHVVAGVLCGVPRQVAADGAEPEGLILGIDCGASSVTSRSRRSRVRAAAKARRSGVRRPGRAQPRRAGRDVADVAVMRAARVGVLHVAADDAALAGSHHGLRTRSVVGSAPAASLPADRRRRAGTVAVVVRADPTGCCSRQVARRRRRPPSCCRSRSNVHAVENVVGLQAVQKATVSIVVRVTSPTPFRPPRLACTHAWAASWPGLTMPRVAPADGVSAVLNRQVVTRCSR